MFILLPSALARENWKEESFILPIKSSITSIDIPSRVVGVIPGVARLPKFPRRELVILPGLLPKLGTDLRIVQVQMTRNGV
ncbi:hypothetical protein L249_8321 [Ophiocordyceps polyrhachis-furcata BCC 54312]|uniref:Uncharacterized protein n=1 Tax=Ophiocordyceps polyrhachis-furcata BCC 54312 TaxID=1330021 RepID=A0A367KZD0_9HYPO|nr:hypothetical protein L249_8320 [Ophiocordyceps polyrhachis-furcata BCC 54312]RCI07530.1 hypothetical protein L249_8321 [Ophiocordyceps polyrhachis-furcata BCC 54312]